MVIHTLCGNEILIHNFSEKKNKNKKSNFSVCVLSNKLIKRHHILQLT